MGVSRCLMHQLDLPFRTRFTHASASRAASDSLVLEIEVDGQRGYGEAVLREYVGGVPSGSSLLDAGAAALAPMIRPLRRCPWEEARAAIETAAVASESRPLLCALETALMDACCRQRGVDVYTLVGREPARTQVRYGAVIPMVAAATARTLLAMAGAGRVPSVRIKLGKDLAYNEMVLSAANEAVGPETTIRADVNMAWDASIIGQHLDLCASHGVRIIEDPAPERQMQAFGPDPRFVFVADESFATEADLQRICRQGLYGMLNIRLSKNGGLLRSLALAAQAARGGLRCCLGCHVGETGILSSLGRTAAALMDNPEYVDGSYDSLLLADNITTANFDFGPGGVAAVRRGEGIGYSVDPEKLRRYTARTVEVDLS